jgi:hypothetical protein
VVRDPVTGKERRSAAELSDAEQAMVVRAARAVGHAACGLDLLRDVRSGETFVCDVNGWSHVYADEYFDSAVTFLIEEQCISSSRDISDEWHADRPVKLCLALVALMFTMNAAVMYWQLTRVTSQRAPTTTTTCVDDKQGT